MVFHLGTLMPLARKAQPSCKLRHSRVGGVHIISDEPVCYPVRRAIYAGARITRCSTASPTKMRTGSWRPFER